jgi:hypothetical protein
MKPEDAKRLADTEVMLGGRTRYVGQEERTDEFLYRLLKERERELGDLGALVNEVHFLLENQGLTDEASSLRARVAWIYPKEQADEPL